MHLLYHWTGKNHRADLDGGELLHLNQNSPAMLQIRPGEHLWAFTRDRAGVYVLAADLVCARVVHNPPGTKYGRYRVYGRRDASRYFATNGAPCIEGLLRKSSIRPNAAILGQSFQGPRAVRPLTTEDHHAILAFSQDLPLEPKVHATAQSPYLLPAAEYDLERAVAVGEPAWGSPLLDAPGVPLSERRRLTLLRDVPLRSRKLSGELQELYRGRCQLCAWEPTAVYGRRICEAHHIHWLSLGGEDALQNLVLLCPNHHRAVHATEAQLDFLDLSFDFDGRREILRLNEHLAAAG